MSQTQSAVNILVLIYFLFFLLAFVKYFSFSNLKQTKTKQRKNSFLHATTELIV